MLELLQFCNDRRDWVLELTRSLASIESPSTDKAALDRCGEALAGYLEAIGASVERVRQVSAGDHLVATIGAGTHQILLLGHFDTVWDVGQLARMPLEVRGGRLHGPGVFDMKGGVAIALLALYALCRVGGDHRSRIVFLCTSDEETGSGSSRSLVEQHAGQSEAVLVLEPALPGGAVKTSRKGVGVFEIAIEGVPSHAGAQPGHGASAIVELAHQILALQRLQDAARGLSVNTGVITGGSRSNVVPERAWAEIDVRVMSLADASRVEAAIRRLTPHDSRTRVLVSGGMNRPPMERTAGVARLYETARSVASELGFTLAEGGTGGASDGNFTAALGIPTLDGLGAVGDGAHAVHEYIEIDSLPQRAALLAGILLRLRDDAVSS
jgi:glutamate carboxypeptidase